MRVKALPRLSRSLCVIARQKEGRKKAFNIRKAPHVTRRFGRGQKEVKRDLNHIFLNARFVPPDGFCQVHDPGAIYDELVPVKALFCLRNFRARNGRLLLVDSGRGKVEGGLPNFRRGRIVSGLDRK